MSWCLLSRFACFEYRCNSHFDAKCNQNEERGVERDDRHGSLTDQILDILRLGAGQEEHLVAVGGGV